MPHLDQPTPNPPPVAQKAGSPGAARRMWAALLGALMIGSGGIADVVDAEHTGHRRLVSEVAWLPADVELVIAAETAGGLIRPPLGPLLLTLTSRGVPLSATMSAWDEFARLLRMEPTQAFDAVLAQRFVFAARRVPGSPEQTRSGQPSAAPPQDPARPEIDSDRVEWVIVTLVDDNTARRLTQTLRAAPRGVRDGRPQLMLEGGTFTLDLKPAAVRGKSWMAIGPTAASGLLDLARLEGPAARFHPAGAPERPAGRIGTDRGFDAIRALARSFRSPIDNPADFPEVAIAAEAAGEFPRSRLFVFARLGADGQLQLSATGAPARPDPEAPHSGDWVALFAEAASSTIWLDMLKSSNPLMESEADFHAWPAAAFDSLSDGALAAGMVVGQALRQAPGPQPANRGPLAALTDSRLDAFTAFGTIAEQLGLPVTRLAWVINDRGGSFDAAIALETAAVDGLVAQGDAFMQAILAPIMGEDPKIHRGVAIGQTVNDHSMRVVRTPRPLAWIPKGENSKPGDAPGGSVAWTYRVCPIAARADEDCPSAWWTVGLSPELVAATTDRLTEEHVGLPQRWIMLQTLRPRALHARLEASGLPVPPGLAQIRGIEQLRWREALLTSGLVLGQGVIEAATGEIAENQR